MGWRDPSSGPYAQRGAECVGVYVKRWEGGVILGDDCVSSDLTAHCHTLQKDSFLINVSSEGRQCMFCCGGGGFPNKLSACITVCCVD